METINDFNKIIDHLRITNDISVDELCDGIISTRTYFRYINNIQNISLSTLSLLLDRLNINYGQLASYTDIFQKSPHIPQKIDYRLKIHFL